MTKKRFLDFNKKYKLFRAKALLIFLLIPLIGNAQNILYVTNNGSVNFTSNAPLEMIKASSSSMVGAVKSADKSFAFSIQVKSFEGFNSTLQRTHFNENYLESDKYLVFLSALQYLYLPLQIPWPVFHFSSNWPIPLGHFYQ